MNLDSREQLLLAQQRAGFARLNFGTELEPEFLLYRVRHVLKRLPVIALVVMLCQVFFLVLDWVLQPTQVSLVQLPLRALSIIATIGVLCYCQYSKGSPLNFLRIFVGVYALHGICVGVMIHVVWFLDSPQEYDRLFLVLIFGYLWLAMPSFLVSAASWLICLVFLGLYPVFGLPLDTQWLYQGVFLLGVNMFGSIGAYSREYDQRQAWLNHQLLDLARRRAEADGGRKLHLLAAAGHDLRQPLNAMGLYVQHLLEQNQDPKVLGISQRLAVAVEQLGRLMQSLFDYTRLTLPGGVRPQMENLALAPLLQRLVQEFRAQADSQGIALHLQCGDLCVRSDPLLLERVLRNLLNNALLHAQAKRVWLHALSMGQGEVTIEVGDDGQGLSEDEQVLVFEEFRQLNNPGRKVERGLGLGLAIVRQLLNALDHKLHLHSAVGQGVRFVLALPQARSSPLPLTQSPVRVISGRVLLIEDDLDSLKAMTALLQGWGCQTWPCTSLAEALGVLAQSQAQVLISDFRLAEDSDGLHAIRMLRERSLRALPALLVSADVNAALQERCVQEGVTLLAKPILPARLQQTLVVLLGLHHSLATTTNHDLGRH